ncbi:MAG: DUF58 domain-containing protein [Halolamina sp.]
MLTRRGRAVVGVGALSLLFASTFGARSLNAVVAPAAVALLAGYLQVARTPALTVTRSRPADAHVGERRSADLSFARADGDAISRSVLGDVIERVGDGLRPLPAGETQTVTERADGDAEIRIETAVGTEPLSYELAFEHRGRHAIGPARIEVTDAFGLFAREIELQGTETTLVYPRIRRLNRIGRRSLGRLEEFSRADQRGEFEELREYVPGDPLRDIHWKTTAKRDEIVVTEFAAETRVEAVSVAAGANADGADAMAEATASIVLGLVRDGVPVDLSLPRGDLRVGPEYGGERALLRTLATVEAGPIHPPDADVVIKGTADDATVDVRGQHHRFSELVGDDARPTEPEVAA